MVSLFLDIRLNCVQKSPLMFNVSHFLKTFSCSAAGNVIWSNAFGKPFGSRYQEIYKFMAFDSLIPFLGTSPKETILIIENALHTEISISAVLLVAKDWTVLPKSDTKVGVVANY